VGVRSSAIRRLFNSSLTAIRSAWKVRVAGWIRAGGCWRGIAEVTMRANCLAVRIGSFSRTAAIRRAILRLWRSSPY
jgi:hypothetical protein